MPTIAKNIEQVNSSICRAAEKCGRNPETVKLVAVTKTVEAERIKKAAAAGLDRFGENYIQEAREKIEALADANVSWHFIGHLQSNKAKYAVGLFDLIHSVDSLKLAKEIDRQAARHGRTQKILVQVNVGDEEQKSGVKKEAAVDLIRDIAALEHISVQGLMTMPPFFDAPEKVRPCFRKLAKLQKQIGRENIAGVEMKELSMGMTGDFEVAIAEGATLVRIGTAIFGERK
ncbi:MAG: YggS family pyridoxal phosphate-dependent enzyme [Desulfobacteraceae bacterium]|nr:YggS family pyridoxal phosphate-dependent enzyme [Desulfobacteraceae bacterium]